MEPRVSVGVLGPLEVRRGEVPVEVAAGKQRLVLLRLVAADGPVGEDALVDALWGAAPPPSAAASLRAHVSRLRTTLAGTRRGGAVLTHSPAGYRLAADVATDVAAFSQAVTMSRRLRDAGQPANAATLLAEALALWRGDAFADARFEPFTQPAITRLESLRLEATETRIALDVDLGRADQVIGELQALIAAHPLRERLHELVVLALYRAGRQGDALTAYAAARQALRDELGVDPSPRLQALHRDVLSHAAAVQLPAWEEAGTAAATSPTAVHLQAAWDALASGGTAVPLVPDRFRGQMLLDQGRALRRSGQVAASRRAYAAAVRLASATGAEEQLAQGALGLAGPPEDTLHGEPLDEPLLTRALLALDGDPGLQVRIRARLGIAAVDRGDVTAGAAMLDAALADARRCGDDRALAYALRARHRTWFEPTQVDGRLALDDELVAIGQRTGDVDTLAWGHRWRGIDLLEAADLEGAVQSLDALEHLTGTDDDAFHRWGVLARRAGLAVLRGPEEVAEAQVHDALALSEAFGSTYTRSTALWLLVACRVVYGRAGEVLPVVEELVAAQPVIAAMRPLVLARAGEEERAAEAIGALLEDGVAAALRVDTIGVARLLSLGALAEAAADLGDAATASVLEPELTPFSGRLVVVPPGLTALATVDHCLGRLAATCGDADRAAAHLAASTDLAERSGAMALADLSRRALQAIG